MRRLLLVPAAGLVLVLLLLLLAQRGGGRGDVRRRTSDAERDTLAVEAAREGEAAGADAEGGETGRPGAAGDFPRAETRGRLVYLDGAPAPGVALHLAVSRPFETRRFRNRDYTAMTIHLVAVRERTVTGEDGSFVFPALAAPPGARRFVYADPQGPAFVLQEVFGAGETLSARRRVRVTGRLTDHEGQPAGDFWFQGQLGHPEDWDTRILREEDCFVDAGGDMGVDTSARTDTVTKDDGSFEILLAEGENTLSFGELRGRGSLTVRVPSGDFDAGALRVPGPPQRSGTRHAVRGRVLNLAGTPHVECNVRAWDGSVGLPTHDTFTDENGRFKIDGLTSSFVILWAVPTGKWHLDLPEQSSGTLRMPCGTDLVLHAPEEEEYAWTRFELQGCYLFERAGVYLGGQALGLDDMVGLPPGDYRIVLVTTGGRLLQATPKIREPGRLDIDRRWFRPLEWQ